MGSEKVCEIAVCFDPRTPLFGERGERDGYSKVWYSQPPKIYKPKCTDPFRAPRYHR